VNPLLFGGGTDDNSPQDVERPAHHEEKAPFLPAACDLTHSDLSITSPESESFALLLMNSHSRTRIGWNLPITGVLTYPISSVGV
jgi:hypothetical protein